MNELITCDILFKYIMLVKSFAGERDLILLQNSLLKGGSFDGQHAIVA